MSQTALVFKVTDSTGKVIHEAFRTERVLTRIGCDHKAHLCITEEDVARLHATIEISTAGQISLMNLDNKVGTKLNGTVLNKTKLLSLGDRITIQGWNIIFECIIRDGVEEKYCPKVEKPTAISHATPHTDNNSSAVLPSFPEWFKFISGFRFVDPDGDLAVILGAGKFAEQDPNLVVTISTRTVEGATNNSFKPFRAVDGQVIAAVLTDGYWQLWDLSLESSDYWNKVTQYVDA